MVCVNVIGIWIMLIVVFFYVFYIIGGVLVIWVNGKFLFFLGLIFILGLLYFGILLKYNGCNYY